MLLFYYYYYTDLLGLTQHGLNRVIWAYAWQTVVTVVLRMYSSFQKATQAYYVSKMLSLLQVSVFCNIITSRDNICLLLRNTLKASSFEKHNVSA